MFEQALLDSSEAQGISDDVGVFDRVGDGLELLERTSRAEQNLHIREAIVGFQGAESDAVLGGKCAEEIEDVVEAFSSEGVGVHGFFPP